MLASAVAAPAVLAMATDRAAAQDVPPVAAAAVAGRSATVTLLTGDRVTVRADGGVAVVPGEGRAHVAFSTRRLGDQLRVVPGDAVPLLDAGRLDPRLFDITALVAAGYDDRRDDLPLIVTGSGGPAARATGQPGVTVGQALPSIGGTAVRVTKGDAGFWTAITAGGPRTLAAGGTTIWLDAVREPALDASVPQIGAPAAWQAGYTGEGVTVAVVDTGIDASHPDLAGAVVAAQDFSGTGSDDTEGHGTHVASTIAGSGAASGGRYQGVAPGVELLDAKVCVGRSCPDSYVIAGMEWAVAQGADVVNMSLGGTDTPEVDPLEQAVNNLTAEHGTLFVISAGNEGDDETVGSPGSADAALTVGAVTKQDNLASFSSRGPRVGDAAIKPDVTAPGQEIVAARSAASSIGDPASRYASLSGTSMAAPHVAGAAAILAQRWPEATPAGLKAVLMASAAPNPTLGAFAQGAGRIDVAAAIEAHLTTSPPSLSFGRQAWPHDDDEPVELTVRFRNTGSEPATVDLTLEVRDESGAAVPEGMFTLSVDALTVPAGGAAPVTVTADTRVDGPVGYLSGHLVATGDGVTARTPLAVDREGQTHRVTATATDRDGNPASAYNAYLVSLDERAEYDLASVDGTTSVRVPEGRYAVIAHIFTGQEGDRRLATLTQPLLVVNGDQELDLDARLAEPVEIDVERRDASTVLLEVSAFVTGDWGDAKYGFLSFSDTPMYTANLGDTPGAGLTALLNLELLRRAPDGSLLDSPYQYHLAWAQSGRMFDGFTRSLRDRDLAQVTARHAGQGDGEVRGAKATSVQLPGVGGGVATVVPFHLPFTRTELYSTEGGVQWSDTFELTGVDGPAFDSIASTYAAPVTYRAGRRYTTDWGRAVFAPALPTAGEPRSGVLRSGDSIIVGLALYGDQAGREGFPASATGRTALYRGGDLIGESDVAGQAVFTVPPEPADYRLEVTAGLDPRLELSRSVSAAWTFPSEHVPGGGGKDGGKGGAAPQPLSMVRFAPNVDADNTLPARRGYVIPVEVYRQGGTTAGAFQELTVSASTDDGKTWEPVRAVLLRDGSGLVIMPAGEPGYVSLRAHARDVNGGTVEVTVLRAYQLA